MPPPRPSAGAGESSDDSPTTNRRGQLGHDNGIDTVGDWIAGEDENGPVAAPSDIGKPDLSPLHWPNTSVQSVSSSSHAWFGHAAVSAAVIGYAAYRSASRSHRRR